MNWRFLTVSVMVTAATIGGIYAALAALFT